MFGVLSPHSTRTIFCTPCWYVMLHLRPLFAYEKTLDRYGQHARSRTRASARRREAPLSLVFIRFFVHIMFICTRHGSYTRKRAALPVLPHLPSEIRVVAREFYPGLGKRAAVGPQIVPSFRFQVLALQVPLELGVLPRVKTSMTTRAGAPAATPASQKQRPCEHQVLSVRWTASLSIIFQIQLPWPRRTLRLQLGTDPRVRRYVTQRNTSAFYTHS